MLNSQIKILGAAKEVTGSCYLLDTGKHRVLLDCGLIQGSTEEEKRNAEEFEFDIQSIDAVILSHAHIDHSGRLPLLVKRGYKGRIYSHAASRDLCAIMLKDAAYINEREVQWENKKRERKGLTLIEPLYTQQDAEQTMLQFESLEYQQSITLFPELKLVLHDAGHILGAAIVELNIRHADAEKKLVFSGDIGHGQSELLTQPSICKQADLLLMESTYGDRLHRPYDDTLHEFAEILSHAKNARSNIIIPAFAVGRTQELLFLFAKYFQQWGLHDWHIFLDSPMAIAATQVHSKHAHLYQESAREFWGPAGIKSSLNNLHFCKTTEESMALNKVRSGAIIIAASGMCTGGRIKHHLKHNAWRRQAHIIISGFQARGTLGRALVDGAKQIKLWGETIQVNAHLHTLGGFSAHADQQGLCNWYGQFKPKTPLVLVHGETRAMQALAEKIHQQYPIQPTLAEQGQIFKLNK